MILHLCTWYRHTTSLLTVSAAVSQIGIPAWKKVWTSSQMPCWFDSPGTMTERQHSLLPPNPRYYFLVSANHSAVVTNLPAAKPALRMSPFKAFLKHSGHILIPLFFISQILYIFNICSLLKNTENVEKNRRKTFTIVLGVESVTLNWVISVIKYNMWYWFSVIYDSQCFIINHIEQLRIMS